jgi:hypothetical protein
MRVQDFKLNMDGREDSTKLYIGASAIPSWWNTPNRMKRRHFIERIAEGIFLL